MTSLESILKLKPSTQHLPNAYDNTKVLMTGEQLYYTNDNNHSVIICYLGTSGNHKTYSLYVQLDRTITRCSLFVLPADHKSLFDKTNVLTIEDYEDMHVITKISDNLIKYTNDCPYTDLPY
jgi:hypothetical protein